jgi:hypothetical protein
VKHRSPECPSRSVQVSISFNFGDPFNAATHPYRESSCIHLASSARIIAVARVANRTRRTSTAAATGIVTGARVSPRLGFMVFADPTRSAAHLAFCRHYSNFSLYDRLFHHARPCQAVGVCALGIRVVRL